MEDLNLVELSETEMEAVTGGYWMVIGAVATTFKTAYETATWYGAGDLGAYLGSEAFDYLN
jgi:hypothetical protein